MNQNLYVNETKLHTRTRFETEVKGNSEIACSQTLFSMASMGGREGGREWASERASKHTGWIHFLWLWIYFKRCEVGIKLFNWTEKNKVMAHCRIIPQTIMHRNTLQLINMDSWTLTLSKQIIWYMYCIPYHKHSYCFRFLADFFSLSSVKAPWLFCPTCCWVSNIHRRHFMR